MEAIIKGIDRKFSVLSIRVMGDNDYYDYSPNEVDIISENTTDTTDWNELRNQVAIAAMQGIMNFFGSLDYNKETIAKLAVEQADALIAELKRE